MTDLIERLRRLPCYRPDVEESMLEAATLLEHQGAEIEALRETLEFYGDESGWNGPPVQTVNHEVFGKAYQNQASKIRLDRGSRARSVLKSLETET